FSDHKMTVGRGLSRTLGIACFLALAQSASTRDQDPALHISAPTEGSYASGPTRLVAAFDPPARTSDVTQVTFFADGRQGCATPQAPFQCDGAPAGLLGD